ncbi:MAG: hypothetical protein JSR46_00210 [Verrucomicrobia bacterium]|nr:hypothetical protein [Verrucomicrobiota bacterium]
MSIPCDLSSTDLTSFEHPVLVYRDKKGDLFLDVEHDFFSPMKRFVYSLLGVRSYRLDTIVNTFAAHESPIAMRNIEFLCSKIAKGCGIDDNTFKTVRIAEKLLQNKQIASPEKEIAEKFFTTLSENPRLQKQLTTFQAKFITNSEEAQNIERLLERARVTSKWLELGLDSTLLNNDYEGAQFLTQTRLIYSIIGFQNSTAEGKLKHTIETNAENKMMIKKQGAYVPLSRLTDELSYDKKREVLTTKDKPEERWNYFSPEGLVSIDRWFSPELVPVEELSKEEMDQLRAHAKEFYLNKEEPPSEYPRDAVIQVVTNPRKEFPFGDFPLTSRLEAFLPVHSALRIITSDGKVYSTGFSVNPESFESDYGKLFATTEGIPTILDYEEFRKHEGRIVTTIPATTNACETIIKTINDYRKETVSYNISVQNCVHLVVGALDQTDVKVNAAFNAVDVLESATPALYAFPLVGEPLGEMKRTIKNITEGEFGTDAPEFVMGARLVQAAFVAALAVHEAITYVPNKIETIFCNVLVLALGGAEGTMPKNRTEGAEVLEHNGMLKRFSSIIRHPLDLFSDETSSSYQSLPLIQWQLQQGTTAIHLYDKQPAMGILPPQVTQETENKKKSLVKKFLTNFGLAA